MHQWNNGGGVQLENGISTPASSQGVIVTGGGSADTKGSYSDLISSTSFDADGFVVTAAFEHRENLLDIAIGAASLEKIILSNHLTEGGLAQVESMSMDIPIPIPKGTRISARLQTGGVSNIAEMSITMYKHGFTAKEVYTGIETWGADTINTGGLRIDPGGTANTKSGWIEFVSAANNKYHTKKLLISASNTGNNADSTGMFLLDIGIGAAGSEKVIIADRVFKSTGIDVMTPYHQWYYVDIPAGTRVAGRVQSSTTNVEDRLTDWVLYAFH